jgi:beta-lactamase regulating signal transducer with metallopeptidase domain
MQRIKGMIDVPIEELLFSVLVLVCIAAWRALPLLCLVLVSDLLLKRRIAAKFHCLLWMVVAARMLCPFSVESSLSIHGNLLTALESVGFSNSQTHAPFPYHAQVSELDFETYSFQNENRDVTTVRQPRLTEGTPPDAKFENAQIYASPQPHALTGIDQPALLDPKIVFCICVAGLWLVVASFLMIRGAVQSLRFSLQLRRSKLITDQSIVDEVLRACDAVGVGRRPALKEVDGLTVPAVFGIRRPTICLPTGTIDELSSRDLRLVLLHELAHVKRRDGLVLSLCLFIRALHWFNPMAWLVVSRIRNYMEQAADEIAMRTSTTSESTDYGRLLLYYASNEPKPRHLAAIGLLFTSPGKKLARRINMLEGSEQRNHCLTKVFAMAAVGTLAVTGLTDAKPVEQHPPARPMYLPQVDDPWEQIEPSFALAHPSAKEQVTETRVYDVSEVLTKLQETMPDCDPADSILGNIALGKSTLSGDRLTVDVPAKRHEAIAERLNQLAKIGHWEIFCKVRCIDVALDQVANLGVDWIADAVQPENHRHPEFEMTPDSAAVLADFDEPAGDDLVIQMRHADSPSRPLLGVKINDQQARLFVQRSTADTRSSIVFDPTIRIPNGISACVLSETVRPFVTGMRPSEASNNRSMIPIVEAFPEGYRVFVRADVSDEEQIRIRCAMILSKLEDVAMANLPTNQDGDSGARLTVQVPQTRGVTIHVGGTLNRSESLLIACPTTFTSEQPRQESHVHCYLITPEWSRDIDGEQSKQPSKPATANRSVAE